MSGQRLQKLGRERRPVRLNRARATALVCAKRLLLSPGWWATKLFPEQSSQEPVSQKNARNGKRLALKTLGVDVSYVVSGKQGDFHSRPLGANSDLWQAMLQDVAPTGGHHSDTSFRKTASHLSYGEVLSGRLHLHVYAAMFWPTLPQELQRSSKDQRRATSLNTSVGSALRSVSPSELQL